MIPHERLSAEERRHLGAAAASPSIHRLLPVRDVRCAPRTFERLMADLPLTAKVVEALGAGRFGVSDAGDGAVSIEEEMGAQARVAPVVLRDGVRAYAGTGAFERLRGIARATGSGAIAIAYEQAPGGHLRARAELWFRLDQSWLHAAARVLEPVLGPVLDRVLGAVVSSTLAVCETVESDPAGTAMRLRAHPGVTAADVERFERAFGGAR